MLRKSNWSRRRFLQHLGMSTCLLPVIVGEGREDKPASVRFGFTLYGMRSLPIAQALKVCASIGYDGVELACMPDWPSAPESLSADARVELRRQVADTGLVVSSLMENISPLADDKIHADSLERLKRACGLARDLAPQSPPLIETVLGGKPADWEQVREKMAARLQDWAKIAESEKIVIALKPHVSGALHTPDGAVWLMEQLKTPWLRLAYDYSHFEVRGLPRQESLQSMLPQTAFIHVKDTEGTAEKFQFLLPGDGRTDYTAYFQQLKAAAYRGPLVVEVSGQIHTRPGYDPVNAAKHCYARLAPLLDRAGLRPLKT